MEKVVCILILAFTMISCENDESRITEVTGIVLDYNSGLAIPNTSVRIRNTSQNPENQQFMTSNPYESTQIFDNIMCDSNGCFSARYKNMPDNPFKLVLYTDSLISVESHSITIGIKNNLIVKVKKLVDYKIKLSSLNLNYSDIALYIENEDKIIEYHNLEDLRNDSTWITRLIINSKCNLSLYLYRNDLPKVEVDTTIYVEKPDSIIFKNL